MPPAATVPGRFRPSAAARGEWLRDGIRSSREGFPSIWKFMLPDVEPERLVGGRTRLCRQRACWFPASSRARSWRLPALAALDGQVAHLKHLLDGRDAGDGLLAELADAVGERAEQLVADVDGAAAHAFDDAGVLGFGAVELGENHVLAGAARAAQNAEDLNLHGFGLGAVKNGPGGAGQAAVNLAEGEESAGGRGGRRPGGLRGWSERGSEALAPGGGLGR